MTIFVIIYTEGYKMYFSIPFMRGMAIVISPEPGLKIGSFSFSGRGGGSMKTVIFILVLIKMVMTLNGLITYIEEQRNAQTEQIRIIEEM